jgi:hypothetical protein
MKILKTRKNSKFYCIFKCRRCDYNMKTSILALKIQLFSEFTYKEHFITQISENLLISKLTRKLCFQC